MPAITFEATLIQINGQTIVRLPPGASQQLPSRGQVAVVGTINGHKFQTVLEPDGQLGHWIRIDAALRKAADLSIGDAVPIELEVTKNWPEPDIPADFAAGLAAAPQKVKDKWLDITPMARWEWVRWVNATARDETRAVRIAKTISKMNGKHRRPCCFNLASCTDTTVSKGGVLLEPEQVV